MAERVSFIWIDSASPEGWVMRDAVKARPEKIATTAYLLEETEEVVIVSAHVGIDSVHAPMTIPKFAIQGEIEYLDREIENGC